MAGSEQAVPVVASLLTDSQFAADAEFALRSLPGAKVDEALRAALAKTPGLLKAGVIQTLGARQDAAAVPLVIPSLTDPDASVVEATLYALGQIGGSQALTALRSAKVPAASERSRQHALLLCAERLLAGGQRAPSAETEASQVYRTLYGDATDLAIKTAA